MPSGKSTTSKKGGAPKLKLVRTADGWGLDAKDFTPDVPIWGGDLTRAEAVEMRRSFLRNGLYEGNGNV